MSVTGNLIEHWRRRRELATNAAVASASGVATTAAIGSTAEVFPPSARQVPPEVLLAAQIVRFGNRTADGQLVIGVAIPWFEIIRHLEVDPRAMFNIPWRRWEEIIAGAFERDGWPEVILTPPSRDKGRDVIATRPGVGSVRIVAQMKAYNAGRVVEADEVAAIFGTLQFDKASKAMIMTTSRFAPGVLSDHRIRPHDPFQLELMSGAQLREWLLSIRAKWPSGPSS